MDQSYFTHCRHARSRYQNYQEQKKKEEEEDEKRKERRMLQDELKTHENRKKSLENEAQQLLIKSDNMSSEGEKQRSWILISQANALRDKVREKRKLIQKVDCDVASLKKRLKSID